MIVGPFVEMQRTNTPKRAVLRFSFRYQHDEAAIIRSFSTLVNSEPAKDFFSHLIPPNESSKMYIVLDLYHKENLTADINEIPYEVFLVKKERDL